jgi:NAD(P)-dependent dehydrogenase (short-subunit alcohol dehydrogenase family)
MPTAESALTETNDTRQSSPWKEGAFENRRVIITGGGRGIGQGIARFYARYGARLLLVARTTEELEQTKAEFPSAEIIALSLDLTLPESPKKVIASALQNWGGLDILVTNAGAAPQGGFLELEETDWPKGFGLKMFANLQVIKNAWPHLKDSRGHLVMIGGGTARTPDRKLSLVSAVNSGQAALCKSIAEQGILDGIHVNLIQPGIVQTRRRQRLFEKQAAEARVSVEEYIKEAEASARVTRLGTPNDIAQVAAFLSSEASRWMQGALVDVDGGQNKGI